MNPIEIEMNFPAEHGGNVFGQFDVYMKKIEKTLHVSLILRGDKLKCIGSQQAVNHAVSVIEELLELSRRGNAITEQNVNYALSLSMDDQPAHLIELDKDVICHTIQGKAVKPKTLGQKKYVEQIKDKMITSVGSIKAIFRVISEFISYSYSEEIWAIISSSIPDFSATRARRA